MATYHGVLVALLWTPQDGSSERRWLFQEPGVRRCLERHGVEVDLRSGEASWQRGLTERMVVGLCKDLPTQMAERGMSENVGELLNWASFTHGQSYQMKGFTLSPLLMGRNPPQLPADPQVNHPNLARLDEKSRATSLAQKIETRAVQGDQFSSVGADICQGYQTSRRATRNPLLVKAERVRAGHVYSVSSGTWRGPAVVIVHERTRVKIIREKSRSATPACHDKS